MHILFTLILLALLAIFLFNQLRTNRAGDEVLAPQALGALLGALFARDDEAISILAGARNGALRVALIVFTLTPIAALQWR